MTREEEIYRVTFVGSVVNMALLTLKFIAGILGHSSAMIADAVHSLSDFITDIIVIVFVRISAKPQDVSHDYGHGKYETIASFLVGLGLVAAATIIVVSGALKIASWLGGEELESPSWLALWAALLSIVSKEAIYRYTVIRGKRLASQALIANAWHHRSDALSSIGATIGIGGAILLGHRWTVLDPIASIVVGAMLVKVAFDLLRNSMNELTECSLPEDTEKEIMDIVKNFPGVSEPHNLRTRRIGNRIAIELHIRMNGDISLREAHDRATEIELSMKKRFGNSTHVSLHMEPTK
ncbi:MAG: cation transporter [Bacteroidales bacterium]|nr:cation transporter [Bacteroidales bacterium]MCR5697126.1 cation diffusion facilitator family transporter [Marinilabiliaceae bacterium]